MTIVQVSAYDAFGGAARAALRLHRGLRAAGVRSSMLVGSKSIDDSDVHRVPRTIFERGYEALRGKLDDSFVRLYRDRRAGFFSVNALPTRVVARLREFAPDVVHLHWVGKGYLRPESLVALEAPIVWTLHDTWPFTGGCHYPGACINFEIGCGSCPILGSTRKGDLSRWGAKRKLRAWKKLDLTVVAPSRWIAACAKRSLILRDQPIRVLPNGVDTTVFRPVERDHARGILGIPRDTLVVLFCAHDVSNPLKGFDLLASSLRDMADMPLRHDLELVVVGAYRLPDGANVGVPVRCLGPLSDEVSLVLANGAADVVVAPSREENLSNTVMEAMACGRPVVAFNVGGMPDLVTNQVHGALVPPYDIRAMRDAIAWTLTDSVRRKALGEVARAKVEREYALPVHAARFADLYRGLCERRSGRSPDRVRSTSGAARA